MIEHNFKAIKSSDEYKIEHDDVIDYIYNSLRLRPNFDLLKNSCDSTMISVSTSIPDIVVLNKETQDPYIIIDVKKNGWTKEWIESWQNKKIFQLPCI